MLTKGQIMILTPLILGSGRSGDVMAKSFAIINLLRPELKLAGSIRLKREANLREIRKQYENPILCIANPHGLHAEAILAADLYEYTGIFCEKPACVDLLQLKELLRVKVPTAILHVYRQMWGIQTLKKMIEAGNFGEIIALEGRYWQSSTAERSLQKADSQSNQSWKDDVTLSGEFDTYLDIGSHWVDAATFLLDSMPQHIEGWRSYINSTSSHRDSHIHLTLQYPKTRALSSISKTIHGATNHFEINIIGSKLTATWNFLSPDEILIGEGKDRRILTRKDSHMGSKQSPFHGMGWIEGYIEIASGLIDHIQNRGKENYPTLSQNLDVLDSMLKVNWK